MNDLKIVIAPDPRLKKKTEEIKTITKEIKQTLKDMQELMYKTNGIGLAAPQVGVNKRMAVIDVSYDPEKKSGQDPIFLINPQIIETSKELTLYNEGCLSLPNIFDEVERPSTCTVKALDLNGKEFTLKCEGLLATCIQHEIDHLDGVIFVDHLSRLKRNRALTKLTKSKKRKEYSSEIFQI